MIAAVRILIWLPVRLVRRSSSLNMAFPHWRMFNFGKTGVAPSHRWVMRLTRGHGERQAGVRTPPLSRLRIRSPNAPPAGHLICLRFAVSLRKEWGGGYGRATKTSEDRNQRAGLCVVRRFGHELRGAQHLARGCCDRRRESCL